MNQRFERGILIAVAAWLVLALCSPAHGQFNQPARRIVRGTNLPATCTIGDVYFKTDATVGTHQCLTTNNWTVMGSGGGGAGGTPGSPLFTQTAGVTVTATAETTLLGAGSGSLTIPVNWFTAAGNSLIVESYGRLTTQATPGTQRIRLKFGATVMLDTGAYALVGSITNGVYRLRTIITARTVGVAGTLIAESIFETTGTALIPNEAKMLNTTTLTVDTTATQVVDFTNLFDTASNSITNEVWTMYGPGSAISSVFGRTGAVVSATNDYNFTQLAGTASAAQVPALPTGVTAAGNVLATAIAAPATPAAGIGSVYVDSTSKNLAVKDDAGVVKHGIQDVTCTNQFIRSVSGAGVGTCATVADADIVAGITRDAEAQAGTVRYARSTTGNDTYVAALTPALTVYTRGGCLVLDADTANTGVSTINVDSLGAKSILNRAGAALADGDITANKPITVCYDGTQYIIQGDGGGGGGGLADPGSNGMLSRTALNVTAARTITGTASEITVADGDGVGANPTLSLPASIDLGAKLLELPNGTAPTGTDCDAAGEAGRIFIDTDAPTGQRVYVCEGVTGWVLQGDGGGGGGANTALSNLAAVSINTSLLAQTGVDAGSTTNPFRNLFLWGAGTFGTTYLELTGTPTGTRVITIPDATDTLVNLGSTQTLTGKTLADSTNAAGRVLVTAIAAPATPAAGIGSVYVDSTSKNIAVKDDAGVVKHGVQTDTGAANNYISAISDAGLITKSRPTCATLSDSASGCSTAALALVTAGTNGIAAYNAGDDTTAARSDHTHQLIGSMRWYFPGVPASGLQNMILALPSGITNALLLNVQASADTPQSAGTTTLNVRRCTTNCTIGGTAAPTYTVVYATGMNMATNVRYQDCISLGTCGTLTTTAAASDRFKADLVAVGTSIADITVELIYQYENK